MPSPAPALAPGVPAVPGRALQAALPAPGPGCGTCCRGAPLAPSPHTGFSSPQQGAAPAAEAKGPAERGGGQCPGGGRGRAGWALPRPWGPGRARPHRAPAPRPPAAPAAPELTGTAFSPCCSEAITRMLWKSMAGPEHGGLRQPPRSHRPLPPTRRPLGPARFRPLPPTLYITSPGASVTSPVAEPHHGKRGWESGKGEGSGDASAEPRGSAGPGVAAVPALRDLGAAPARPGPALLAAPPLTAGAGTGDCSSAHLG